MLTSKHKCVTYHLLGHLLRNIFVELEQELNGIVVLVFSMELFGVVHSQPQLQARLHRVVFLRQLHVDAIAFMKERVIQEILNGVPAQREGHEPITDKAWVHLIFKYFNVLSKKEVLKSFCFVFFNHFTAT